MEPINDWDDIADSEDAPQHHVASSTFTAGEGEAGVMQGEDDDPQSHQGAPAPDLNEDGEGA